MNFQCYEQEIPSNIPPLIYMLWSFGIQIYKTFLLMGCPVMANFLQSHEINAAY